MKSDNREKIHRFIGRRISKKDALKGLGDPNTWKTDAEEVYREFRKKPCPEVAKPEKSISARFTPAQSRAMWTLLDSLVTAREIEGDKSDANKWRQLRDKFLIRY
jgi:hypothetical protein